MLKKNAKKSTSNNSEFFPKFKKTIIRYLHKDMSKFQSARSNGVAKIERNHIHTFKLNTHIMSNFRLYAKTMFTVMKIKGRMFAKMWPLFQLPRKKNLYYLSSALCVGVWVYRFFRC